MEERKNHENCPVIPQAFLEGKSPELVAAIRKQQARIALMLEERRIRDKHMANPRAISPTGRITFPSAEVNPRRWD